MKFWDSSALLPLLVKEATTPLIKKLFEAEGDMSVWWGTEVECLSALARRAREGRLTSQQHFEAATRLQEILSYAIEVNPSLEIKRVARRLLRLHPLRAADSLQLAAALVLAGENVSELMMVTLDEQLKRCAEQEGLQVTFKKKREY